MIGVFTKHSYTRAGDLFGQLASVEGAPDVGILDGGIPHYNHGGIAAGAPSGKGRNLLAWNCRIGVVTESHQSFLQFETSATFRPKVDSFPIHGVSCYIFSKTQTVKGMPPVSLIPEKYGQFEGVYSEGDVVMVSFE